MCAKRKTEGQPKQAGDRQNNILFEIIVGILVGVCILIMVPVAILVLIPIWLFYYVKEWALPPKVKYQVVDSVLDINYAPPDCDDIIYPEVRKQITRVRAERLEQMGLI